MKIENKSCLILGIGGVSVHQIALALKNLGIKVYGYDAKENQYTQKCKDAGIEITNKFKPEFLKVNFCVKTGAITNNKYITALKKLNVKIYDRAEMLSLLISKFKCVIAVAGTHGKSTTASLIYEILRVAGKKVSCHIGADVFASRFDVEDDFLVLEACEFNKSFLSFYPTISVVTNVEAEHLDSYGSIFNLKNAFSVFLRRGQKRFIFDDKSTVFLQQIKNVEVVKKTNLDIKPRIAGEHNLNNISLAIAVAKSLGIDEKTICKVINMFEGLPRRYEFLGYTNNQKIFIDYAHHPTEIKAFVETFFSQHKNCLIVFQPHTYSRTKLLLKQFIDVLSAIDNLIIYKEYPAREKPWKGLSAFELFEHVKQKNNNVKYFETAKSLFKNMANYSAIAFVGAGNIDQIAKKFIKSI